MSSAQLLIHVYAFLTCCHGDALGKTCLIVYPAPHNFPMNPTTFKVILRIRKKGPTFFPFVVRAIGEKKESEVFHRGTDHAICDIDTHTVFSVTLNT
jgi:hypothetical protein